LNSKIIEFNKELKKKKSEVDHEKDEQKMRHLLEEKFMEFKEQQRTDRNDYNSKLAT